MTPNLGRALPDDAPDEAPQYCPNCDRFIANDENGRCPYCDEPLAGVDCG